MKVNTLIWKQPMGNIRLDLKLNLNKYVMLGTRSVENCNFGQK